MSHAVRAGSGLGLGDDWEPALATALAAALAPLDGHAPDLLVLFASPAYRASYRDLVDEAAARSGAGDVVGCSAAAIIAGVKEIEDQPGIAALALCLPAGSEVRVRRVAAARPGATLGLAAGECTGLIVLADPFTFNVEALVNGLEQAYPGVAIMGGLATGEPGQQQTFLFGAGEVASEGAVVVGFSGSVGLRPVVSQGCEPIGAAWTITDAERNVVKSIGGRPAYQVLVDTVRGLDDARRERVNGNLLVGLAIDEYRHDFKRGDFLIRNLIGIDQASGAIAIAALASVGQTLQFQIRDARAADEELRQMLGVARGDAGRATPTAAALLFACNGRGIGLFGAPDHDARTVGELLGPVPLAGLFCNGEIGPVGSRTFVHGFTASLALIAPLE